MISGQEIIYGIRYLIIDLIKDILFFPIWWYTQGLYKAGRFFVRQVRNGSNRLALPILFKYWFKPMYGQTDWQGKLISFFMRSVNLVWNLILMVLWTLVMIVVLLIYITLPLFILYQIINFSK